LFRALCTDFGVKRTRRLHVVSQFSTARLLPPLSSLDLAPVSLGNCGCGADENLEKSGSIGRLERLPLACIDENPFRLRIFYNEQEQAELAASITYGGLQNPIHVRRLKNGRFQVIDGGRRLRVLQDLQRADAPAFVVERADDAALLDAVMLNSARAELSDYERAKAYKQLLDRGIVQSQQELAKLFGCSQPTVSNILSMLDLPASARQFLERHPRVISSKSARYVGTLYREFPEHEPTILEGLDQLQEGRIKPQALKAWMTKRISETQTAGPAETASAPGIRSVVIKKGADGDTAFVVDTSTRQREILVQVEDPDISMTMVMKVILQALRSVTTSGAPDHSSTVNAEEPVRDPVNDGSW